MNEKAVFLATKGLMGDESLHAAPQSPSFTPEEWKALRLLTLAGYTIVLFTARTIPQYAPDTSNEWSSRHHEYSDRCQPVSQHPTEVSKQVTTLLEATAKLQVDLPGSWIVGDRLDTIEVGRLVGCSTIFVTDGSESGWEMTATRWPDLIAGDLWETACLIVISDGSSVEGLSSHMEDDLDSL
jgi:phosphoglycolate phosphatase-like HAD superfamily hydrolase